MKTRNKTGVLILLIAVALSVSLKILYFRHKIIEVSKDNIHTIVSATLVVDSVERSSGAITVKGRISNWEAIAGTGITIELSGSGLESQLRPKMWCDVEFQSYDVQSDQVIVPKNSHAKVTAIAKNCEFPSASVAFSKKMNLKTENSGSQ